LRVEAQAQSILTTHDYQVEIERSQLAFVKRKEKRVQALNQVSVDYFPLISSSSFVASNRSQHLAYS
jgi:hypothetical protein